MNEHETSKDRRITELEATNEELLAAATVEMADGRVFRPANAQKQ